MGETDCSKSSNIATLTFALSENPILDLKVGTGNHGSKLKAKDTSRTRPEFRWHVSAGTISKGEGTDEITIDTTGLGGQVLTATAELTGAPSGCKHVASITTSITPPPPPSCPFISYGDIKFEDEKARLDNFAIQILNSSPSRGLILMYAGKETFKGEAAYRLQRAKSYLAFRGLDASRIIAVDCGFANDLTAILYVVPDGVKSIPGCDTSWNITLSEVKFTKPRPKSANKRR